MKTVFFDIDTQIDFVYPAGALYVPGAEEILPVIGQLNRKAPIVISTMDAHSENDPEFQIYPHHCVVGTVGQQKPAATLIEKRDQQIIIEKQTLDCFSNPKLSPLLAELNADRYVVYVVAAEICVRLAIFRLLNFTGWLRQQKGTRQASESIQIESTFRGRPLINLLRAAP